MPRAVPYTAIQTGFLKRDERRYAAEQGLPELKFHDLRKTFASLLAQRGVSTAVTQRLLEHSSPKLTNDVYANVDPALRHAIDLLRVAEWKGSPIYGLRPYEG